MYERDRVMEGERGGGGDSGSEGERGEGEREGEKEKEEEEKKRSNKCSFPLGTVEFITGRRLETR